MYYIHTDTHTHVHTHTHTHTHTHHTVVGNNIHLPTREVDQKLAADYAKDNRLPYLEISARTGQGVDEAFHTLVREIRYWVSLAM